MENQLTAHIIPQDLPASQTRSLIVRQLQEVKDISAIVFEQIQAALDKQNDEADNLEKRLLALEKNVALLARHKSKALKATAPLQHPTRAYADNKYCLPSVLGQVSGITTPEDLETQQALEDSSRTKTKELYAFFKQAQAQQSAPSQEGRSGLQQQVEYVTNLFEFNAQELTSRLQRTRTATKALVVAEPSQRRPATLPQNAHLAVESLTASFERPQLQARPTEDADTPASLSVPRLEEPGADAAEQADSECEEVVPEPVQEVSGDLDKSRQRPSAESGDNPD